MLFLNFILDGVRHILLRLVYYIYMLIREIYNLFIQLSIFNLFTFEEVSGIYKRFEVILAVVMVFYVSFTAIKYIVNPETVSDKEKGGANLLKKMVVVVVLIVFSPQIFEGAALVRENIVKNGIIPQIITGDSTLASASNAGGEFSGKLLNLFYYAKDPDANCDGVKCGIVVQDRINYIKGGTLTGKDSGFTNHIANEANGEYLINFDSVFAIGVGLFVGWVLINYCAEAARVIFQLLFLEVIAPIPIMSYLSPDKDGMFQKWVKQLTSTYLDVIIRLFVIYLMFFFSNELLNRVWDGTRGLSLFMKIFLIIGLLYFATKAPALIKELLPKGLDSAASGSFGFGKKTFQDRFNPSARLAGAALGATRGAAKGLGRLAGAWARDFKKNGFSIKGRVHGAADSIRRANRRRAAALRNKWDRALQNDAASRATRAARAEYDKELEEEAKLSKAERIARKDKRAREYIANRNKMADLKIELENTKDVNERSRIQNEIDKISKSNKQLSNELNSEYNSGLNNALEKTGFKTGFDAKSLDKLAEKTKSNADAVRAAQDDIKKQDDIINNSSSTQEQKNEAIKKKKELEGKVKELTTASTREKVTGYAEALTNKENADKTYNEKLMAYNEELEKTKLPPSDPKYKPANNPDLKKAEQEKNIALGNKNGADNILTQRTEEMLGKSYGVGNSYEKNATSKGVISGAYEKALIDSQTDVTKSRDKLFKAITDEKTIHAQEDAAQLAEKNMSQQDGGFIKGITGFVGGTVSGAAKGVAQGLKTKEITKVIPDYVKGIKSDIKIEQSRQEFINNGGVVGVGADISRFAQNAGQIIGIPTQVQSLNASIKPIENMIKGEEATMKVEKDASSSYDTMKSSLASAREGNKLSMSLAEADNVTDKSNNTSLLDIILGSAGGSKTKIAEMLAAGELKDSSGNAVTDLKSLGDTRELIRALQTRSDNYKIQYEELQKQATLAKDGSPEKADLEKRAFEMKDKWNKATDDVSKLSSKIDRITATAIMQNINEGETLEKLVTIGEPSVKTAISTMTAAIQATLSNSDTVSQLLSKKEIGDELKSKIRSGDYAKLNVDDFNTINDVLKEVSGDRATRLAELNETVRQGKDQIAAKEAQDKGYDGGSGSNGGSGK